MGYTDKIRVSLAAILLSTSLILFTCLLLLIVIPEYHGSLFRFGKCRITNHTTDYNTGVEWKTCSCGVMCTSQYPCSSVTGSFTPMSGHYLPRDGVFYSDYSALIRGCYKFPYNGECTKLPQSNKKFIEHWTDELPDKFGNGTFHCYGLGTSFYPFQTNMYHASLGHIAFFPSLALVAIAVYVMYKSSNKVRECMCYSGEGHGQGRRDEEEEEAGPLLRPVAEVEREYDALMRKPSTGEPSAPIYDDDDLPPPYQI